VLDPNLSLPVPSSPRRGRPLIAWLVIVGVVGFIAWRNWAEGHAESVVEEKSVDVLLRMQGRLLVGLGDVMGQKQEAVRQAEQLNHGPPAQRLRCAVLLGELESPAAARALVEELLQTHREEGTPLSPEADRLAHLLLRLYAGYEKHPDYEPDLTAAQQAELRRQLGWFGALALAPQDSPDPEARQAVLASARRTLAAIGGLFAILGFAFFAGMAIVILMAALWFNGELRGGLATGATPGGIYAETFAWYLVLFVGLSFALHFVPVTGSRLFLSGAAALGSLAALAWPVLRGIPWPEVRRDVGLFVRSAREPLFGVGCYLASIPVLAVGVLIYYGLSRIQQHWFGGPGPETPGNSPVHPIVGQMATGGWWVWLQMFLMASVGECHARQLRLRRHPSAGLAGHTAADGPGHRLLSGPRVARQPVAIDDRSRHQQRRHHRIPGAGGVVVAFTAALSCSSSRLSWRSPVRGKRATLRSHPEPLFRIPAHSPARACADKGGFARTRRVLAAPRNPAP
jgi:hypothetical protein